MAPQWLVAESRWLAELVLARVDIMSALNNAAHCIDELSSRALRHTSSMLEHKSAFGYQALSLSDPSESQSEPFFVVVRTI